MRIKRGIKKRNDNGKPVLNISTTSPVLSIHMILERFVATFCEEINEKY